MHRAGQRRDRARLPDARRAGERLQGGHHRGPFGFRRAEGAAKGLSREERAAMRLLHAGNADGRPGSGSSEEEVLQRRDQKPYLRQLLPLHGLPGHRRRHRAGIEWPKLNGRAVAEYCTPWIAVLAHLKGIKSPPQHAIAIERACWQGEAVAAVVAESRSQAEDAVALIEAQWEELPVVVDMDEALTGNTVIHPELGDNICFKRELDTGGVEEAFARADVVVEDTFHFGRHTGVCLEGRAILADYNAAEHSLTVYHATQ